MVRNQKVGKNRMVLDYILIIRVKSIYMQKNSSQTLDFYIGSFQFIKFTSIRLFNIFERNLENLGSSKIGRN